MIGVLTQNQAVPTETEHYDVFIVSSFVRFHSTRKKSNLAPFLDGGG